MEAILELVRSADAHTYADPQQRRNAHSDASTFGNVAVVLAGLLEQKDPATLEHGMRVYRYAERLGRALGTSGVELDVVRRAAYLHDVGKLNVPDEILNKPGNLTADERRMTELHTTCGENLLSESRNAHMRTIAAAVGAHHENFDGTGYPRRLKGEQIPLAARIIAVCDTFDVITSDRPYHKAQPAADALAELRANAGTQFDPQIVEAFMSSRCWDSPDRAALPAAA